MEICRNCFDGVNVKPLSIFDRVYIVDNFYTQPDDVRQFAISQEKENSSNGNYAGVMSVNSFLTQEHIDTFKELTGQSVFPSTSFNGKFRFSQINDTFKQDIHFDPGENNCAWAGVVYLTPNVENTDGTIFWKHKRTGLESIPRTLEGINEYGWKDTNDLKQFLDTDGMDHSLWEKTLTIPYRYNRLILFRPWMFHSPGPLFGNTIDTARVIQTFFWS